MNETDSRDRIRVRTIDAAALADWLTLPGAPADDVMGDRLAAAWASGAGGPDRTFLLERDGAAIGRVAYVAEPAASGLPEFLEARLVGFWLPRTADDAVDLGVALIGRSVAALPATIRAVDVIANPALMPDWEFRRAVFEALDLPLFQEKVGFEWRRDAPPAARPEPRLTFRSVAETGGDLLADVMDRTTIGTLDRQDRYYAALVGPGAWGREMLGFRTDEDAPDWLVALDAAGTAVGHVLLGRFDGPDRGTIVHVGVVPEARGRGYVHELLAEATERARRRGFGTVLSDCDALNPPMIAAMERAGHHTANTTWHVWHHRLER